MKDFFCMDCRIPVSLSRHGRCEQCNSDSIALSVPPRLEMDLYELEKIMREEGVKR